MTPARPPNALIPGGSPLAPPVTLQPAISARDSLLAPNTIRGYVRDWLDFFRVEEIGAITMPMCVRVTPEEVTAFRDELIAKGLGPGTIARKLTALRTLYDYLIARKLLVLNPANTKLVRAPKRGLVKKMDALSQDEAVAFLNVIDRTTPIGRRDYALIMTDLHMGLRRSEALSIRVENFKRSGDQAFYLFRGKHEKERLVAINRDLEVALAAYAADRGTHEGYLFPGREEGKHLHPDHFWAIVKAYLVKAGIKKRVGTHGLRATFITHNIASGTPLDQIQRTVGHTKPDTTLGYARDMEMIKSKAPQTMEGFRADEQAPK